MIYKFADSSVLNNMQFRALFPETCFPATLSNSDLEPFGCMNVVQVAPVPSEGYQVANTTVVLVAGVPTTVHSYEPIPPVVVYSVSPRQIRQALTAVGLRSSVEAAVAAGDQNLKDWWEFSTEIERFNPEVIAMADGLGVTPESMSDLFTLAASL